MEYILIALLLVLAFLIECSIKKKEGKSMPGSEREITSEMVKIYRDNHGDRCPFCDSDQVDVGDDFREYNAKGGVVVKRGMDCMNRDCRKGWVEVFELIRIE